MNRSTPLRNGASFSLPASILFALILTMLFTLNGVEATAQPAGVEECMGGKRYYIAFPDTVQNAEDTRFPQRYPENFLFYIYSPVTQTVSIRRPGGAAKPVEVEGGKVLEFNTRELIVPIITNLNGPNSNTLLVTAESPIVIYAYFFSRFGTAAFTPLPVEAWGTEYFAPAWPGEYVRNIIPAGETNYDATQKVRAPAEILIIASEDLTTVKIEPTTSLLNCSNCTQVLLKKAGEAYLVQSFVDINEGNTKQYDLAGTRITADKPIGVVSGNTRMQHGSFPNATLAGNSMKDLALEWISPVERYGQEFVFTPTWDDRRPLSGLPEQEVREAEFIRVYGTNATATTYFYTPEQPGDRVNQPLTMLEKSGVGELQVSDTTARKVWSSAPGMAFQSPKSVVNYLGTTTEYDGVIGSQYHSWGTYMAEMVPRERWGNFAPFYATRQTKGMRHYINVVTDQKSAENISYWKDGVQAIPFEFNRGPIAGTDLVWGTMEVDTGVTYLLTGSNGARFTGIVYGSWRGFELYRPGGNKKGDSKMGEPAALHPSEYEENIAQMYAYPLVAYSCNEVISKLYDIDATREECGTSRITIRSSSDDPVGLKTIRLHPDSTSNMTLEFISPASADDVDGATEATVRLVPIDQTKPGSAVLQFEDRSGDGKVYRVESIYRPSFLTPKESSVSFGSYATGDPQIERRIVLHNYQSTSVPLRQVRLLHGDAGYTIDRTIPGTTWNDPTQFNYIGSGDSLIVIVRLKPGEFEATYDSLIVEYECLQSSIGLNAVAGAPCLSVSDVYFGKMKLGEEVTRTMQICNEGIGTVTFTDSSSTGGGAFLTWVEGAFRVDASEIEKLKNASLGPGECITISITFRSLEEFGQLRTTARLWTSAQGCDNESVWSADVLDPSLTVRASSEGRRRLDLQVHPNPSDGLLNLEFSAAPGEIVRITLLDNTGREVAPIYRGKGQERIERIERITWQSDNLPAGVYFVRLQIGEEESVERVYLVK